MSLSQENRCQINLIVWLWNMAGRQIVVRCSRSFGSDTLCQFKSIIASRHDQLHPWLRFLPPRLPQHRFAWGPSAAAPPDPRSTASAVARSSAVRNRTCGTRGRPGSRIRGWCAPHGYARPHRGSAGRCSCRHACGSVRSPSPDCGTRCLHACAHRSAARWKDRRPARRS